MNIYDQLQAVEDRYEELGELLSDPDVVSDTKRFMELSKEESATRDTVTAYREYKTVLQNIIDAEEMIKESVTGSDVAFTFEEFGHIMTGSVVVSVVMFIAFVVASIYILDKKLNLE